MTENLKTLMHERATRADFASPDLDAIVRAGDRQVRRRRGITLVGGIAAAAVVGGAAFTQLGSDEPRSQVAVEPPAAAPVTWAMGSVLHTPTGEIDLGHDVRAYVRTSVSHVFSDRDGDVFSWEDGRALEVGHTDARNPRLVSDDESGLAGWVDPTGAEPVFVVLDQVSGETTTYDDHVEADMGNLADEADPAYFYAIDDRTAYWRDGRGAVAFDLDSEEVTVIDANARNGFGISDVENGVFAFTTENGTFVGPSRSDGIELPQTYGGFGAFSPDARYYSSEGDAPEVFDATTGEQVTLDLDGRQFGTGYEWLDDQTLVVLAAEKARMDSMAELLTCTVPDGACEFVTELGTFEDIAGVIALPGGESTGD